MYFLGRAIALLFVYTLLPHVTSFVRRGLNRSGRVGSSERSRGAGGVGGGGWLLTQQGERYSQQQSLLVGVLIRMVRSKKKDQREKKDCQF